MFQTAPGDEELDEPVQAPDKPLGDPDEEAADGFESDASSDILEPTQVNTLKQFKLCCLYRF